MRTKSKSLLILGAVAIVGTASTWYNSLKLNDNSFMSAYSELDNNRRLDELNQNKIVVGRMAASTAKWEKLETIKKEAPVALPKKKSKLIAAVTVDKNAEELEEVIEPAIKEDLDLELVAVKLGVQEEGEPSKSIELKSDFSGQVRTSNGFIDDIEVTFPNGESVVANGQQLSGNVFEYHSLATGKKHSAMIYESGKDTFTVMLTDDPRFPGTNLTFKTAGAALKPSTDMNWQMNEQNYESEMAQNHEPAQEEQYEYPQHDYYQEEGPQNSFEVRGFENEESYHFQSDS